MNWEKHLSIIDHAFDRLRRQPFRHLMVFVVFAFTVFVLTSVMLTTAAIEDEAYASLETAPDITVQELQGGRQVPMDLNESALQEIREVPGVKSVNPRVWGHYYDTVRSSLITIYGVDTPTEAPPGLVLESGRNVEGQGEAIIGKGVAERADKEVGDKLWLLYSNRSGSAELEVVGIFSSDSSVLTNDVVVTSKADARQMFGVESGTYTDLAVRLYNSNEVDNVAEKLRYAFPGSRVLTRDQIRATYSTALGWRSGLFIAALIGCIAAFLVLAWNQSVSGSGRDRREIGILKATGWETSEVLELKMAEGLIVSLTAFLVGAAASYVYVAFFGAPLFTRLLAGWSEIYPGFSLAAHVSLDPLIPVFALSVVPFMAATLVPSWRAATVDPDEVMRGG